MRHKFEGSKRFDMRGGSQRAKRKIVRKVKQRSLERGSEEERKKAKSKREKHRRENSIWS